MPEDLANDHTEFLLVLLLMNEKTDIMLDSIEEKLLENPSEDQILVNAKALLNYHLILSTYKSLAHKLVEENAQIQDRLAEFVEKALKK
jgi:hypothetical protein